jgi:hypothetical protein
MVNLKVDYCSHEAAKYACEHWHYSRCIPAGKNVFIGVWEDNKFIGVVIFGWGVNRNIGSPYNLKQVEVCELVRVALNNHTPPVSQIVARSINLLKTQSKGLKLIVSYADRGQGHTGIIYQAMNWVYVGQSQSSQYKIKGKLVHKRTIRSKYGREDIEYLRKVVDKNIELVAVAGKHKYLYPLDRKMARQIEKIALPYPKKDADSLR